MHSDTAPTTPRLRATTNLAGGLSRDDTHWWKAYAQHSAVDGKDRAPAASAAARTGPSSDVLTSWWNEIAGARMPMAVFDAPHDIELQYLVSGHGTHDRQEMMIERIDARRSGSHEGRMFFRRLRDDLADWGDWLPM